MLGCRPLRSLSRTPLLTSHRAGSPPRTVRNVARPATIWGLALGLALAAPAGWATPATAATSAGSISSAGTVGSSGTSGSGAQSGSGDGSTLSSLQTQAQELAGQIAADGRQLDELSAAYQSALINYSRLNTRRTDLQRSMAATAASVAGARQALKNQAILAYLAGGAPIINYVPDRPGMDPSLTVSYAEIVANGQQTAVRTYRATLQTEAHQKAALEANAKQVQITLATIQTDQAKATATLAARQQALGQVKGQMAVEVARVQAQQQAAEQAQERAVLAAQGQLPPSIEATSTASSPATHQAPSRNTAPARPNPTAAPSSGAPATSGRPAPTPSPSTRPTTPATAPPSASPPSTSPPNTAPPAGPPPSGSPSAGSTAQAPGADKALSYARAQLGKPYQWGGAGPDSFDCSGLVMMAWDQAGIYFPHLAQDQYNLTARIPLSALIPGDLVFYGTADNVYHVGIYIGNGDMIDAPETGQNVQVQSIYWASLLGAGRVTTSS